MRALTLMTVLLCAGVVQAQDWAGFRGVQRQNVAPSPGAPLRWTTTDSVRWRTPLPGEGHSSPILVGDAVYLSVGIEQPQRGHFLLGARLVLLLLACGLVAAVLWEVVGRCGSVSCLRELPPLVGTLALAFAFPLMVMYGEKALTFERALERPWMTGVLSLVLGLVMVQLSGHPRARLMSAFGLIVTAAVACLVIPDRAHAFDYGMAHPKSLFLSAVIAGPLFLGLMSGALTLRRSRPLIAWALALPGWLLLAMGVTALVLAVVRAQGRTIDTVSYSPYLPQLKWWLPAGLLVVGLVLLTARSLWPRALAVNVMAVTTLASFVLTALGFGIEHLVAAVGYLEYLADETQYLPFIARWLPRLVLAMMLLTLVAATVATRSRPLPAGGLAPLVSVLAFALGVAYFSYALWVPRERMFLRGIICLDRDSGAVRWQRVALRGPREVMSGDNSTATPTPVSDGERVFAYFGTPGVMAVSRDGRVLWTNRQLPFSTAEGVASSPVVWQNKVIVLSESRAGRWLVALDCGTGRLRWRTPRYQKMHMYAGNCRTPLIWPVLGRPTVIIWGREDVSGYDPETGRELWTHPMGTFGDSTNPVACLVADRKRLYLSGPTETVALSLDRLGRGGSPVVWTTLTDGGPQCSTPVLHRGMLFAVSDPGVVYCFDARTGRLLWEQDFPRQHYASPLAVGDRLYVTDTGGKTHVLAVAPQCRVLATSDLHEPISASLVPAAGKLYVRTGRAAWCLAGK